MERPASEPQARDLNLADCDCILLAAGLSSRSTDHKLLRLVDGEPLIARAVRNAAVCGRVILVLGHRANEILAAAHQSGIDRSHLLSVTNEHYASGMFSSVQAGMREVTSEWFFVAPGDLPDLQRNVFDGLRKHAIAETEPGSPSPPDAIVPTFRDQRGHPVLMRAPVLTRALGLPRNGGPMRTVLAQFTVSRLAMEEPGIVRDLDSDADYARYTSRRENESPRP